MIYEAPFGWMDFLFAFAKLAYGINPVSEYLVVVNNCHISQFHLHFYFQCSCFRAVITPMFQCLGM